MRVSLAHSETYARRKLERPGTARTKHLRRSTGGLTKSWGQQRTKANFLLVFAGRSEESDGTADSGLSLGGTSEGAADGGSTLSCNVGQSCYEAVAAARQSLDVTGLLSGIA